MRVVQCVRRCSGQSGLSWFGVLCLLVILVNKTFGPSFISLIVATRGERVGGYIQSLIVLNLKLYLYKYLYKYICVCVCICPHL